jgi:long-chain fatty acid transport protein
MEITGNTIQWGVNSGIYYQPTEQLNIGLSYKSAMNLGFNDATAVFNIPSSLQSFFPGANSVSANYYLPAIIDLHASTRLSTSWAIAIAAGMKLKQNNANTTFDFSYNNSYLQDFQIYRDDKIQFVSRIGAEYLAAEFLHFRAGMYYQDGTSGADFFSPEKPDAQKIGISAGITLLPLDGLSLDLSFTYINSNITEAQYIPANFGGTYKSAVYMSGLGITYRF